MYKFIDFTDKVCIVTGAGSESGIGFRTAEILGKLGAKVVLVSTTDRINKRADELKKQGIESFGYIADLIDRKQVKSTVLKIIEDHGKVDVLINNAGMTQVGEDEDFSNFAEISYESWDFTISRNLTLCFNVTREILPHMIERKYGRIVNTSSVTGPIVSNPGESAYSAAKAAISGMCKGIAIEVAKDNIIINNVLPGWISTASQTESEAAGGENTPIGRGGDAAEVANLNVFLASDRASYITGQDFVVDGGNTIQEYKGPPELYY